MQYTNFFPNVFKRNKNLFITSNRTSIMQDKYNCEEIAYILFILQKLLVITGDSVLMIKLLVI